METSKQTYTISIKGVQDASAVDFSNAKIKHGHGLEIEAAVVPQGKFLEPDQRMVTISGIKPGTKYKNLSIIVPGVPPIALADIYEMTMEEIEKEQAKIEAAELAEAQKEAEAEEQKRFREEEEKRRKEEEEEVRKLAEAKAAKKELDRQKKIKAAEKAKLDAEAEAEAKRIAKEEAKAEAERMAALQAEDRASQAAAELAAKQAAELEAKKEYEKANTPEALWQVKVIEAKSHENQHVSHLFALLKEANDKTNKLEQKLAKEEDSYLPYIESFEKARTNVWDKKEKLAAVEDLINENSMKQKKAFEDSHDEELAKKYRDQLEKENLELLDVLGKLEIKRKRLVKELAEAKSVAAITEKELSLHNGVGLKIKKELESSVKKELQLKDKVLTNLKHKGKKANDAIRHSWKIEDEAAVARHTVIALHKEVDEIRERMQRKKDRIAEAAEHLEYAPATTKHALQKEIKDLKHKLHLREKELKKAIHHEDKAIANAEKLKHKEVSSKRDAELHTEVAHVAQDAAKIIEGVIAAELERVANHKSFDKKQRYKLLKEVESLKAKQEQEVTLNELTDRPKFVVSEDLTFAEKWVKGLHKDTYWVVFERGFKSRGEDFKKYASSLEEEREQLLREVAEKKAKAELAIEKHKAKVEEELWQIREKAAAETQKAKEQAAHISTTSKERAEKEAREAKEEADRIAKEAKEEAEAKAKAAKEEAEAIAKAAKEAAEKEAAMAQERADRIAAEAKEKAEKETKEAADQAQAVKNQTQAEKAAMAEKIALEKAQIIKEMAEMREQLANEKVEMENDLARKKAEAEEEVAKIQREALEKIQNFNKLMEASRKAAEEELESVKETSGSTVAETKAKAEAEIGKIQREAKEEVKHAKEHAKQEIKKAKDLAEAEVRATAIKQRRIEKLEQDKVILKDEIKGLHKMLDKLTKERDVAIEKANILSEVSGMK